VSYARALAPQVLALHFWWTTGTAYAAAVHQAAHRRCATRAMAPQKMATPLSYPNRTIGQKSDFDSLCRRANFEFATLAQDITGRDVTAQTIGA